MRPESDRAMRALREAARSLRERRLERPTCGAAITPEPPAPSDAERTTEPMMAPELCRGLLTGRWVPPGRRPMVSLGLLTGKIFRSAAR